MQRKTVIGVLWLGGPLQVGRVKQRANCAASSTCERIRCKVFPPSLEGGAAAASTTQGLRRGLKGGGKDQFHFTKFSKRKVRPGAGV